MCHSIHRSSSVQFISLIGLENRNMPYHWHESHEFYGRSFRFPAMHRSSYSHRPGKLHISGANAVRIEPRDKTGQPPASHSRISRERDRSPRERLLPERERSPRERLLPPEAHQRERYSRERSPREKFAPQPRFSRERDRGGDREYQDRAW